MLLLLLFSNLSFAEIYTDFIGPARIGCPRACARARADLAWLDILTLCFASFFIFRVVVLWLLE